MKEIQNKINKINAVIEKFLDKSLLFICFLILGGLTFYSFRYTGDLIEGTEIPIIMPDSIGKNFLVIFIISGFIFISGKLINKKLLPCSTPPKTENYRY